MITIRHSTQLAGEITVSGSKNAALPLLAASQLIGKSIFLENVPEILDTQRLRQVAELAETSSSDRYDLTDPLVQKMRASILLIPHGLRKRGKVRCAGSGGCKLGKRSLDTFDDAFEQAGVRVEDGDVKTYEVVGKPNKEIVLNEFSVTTAEAIITYLAFHEEVEQVIVRQIAIEPHVVNLIEFLNRAGADITLQYDHSALIRKGSIDPKVASFAVRGDYLEAGLFLAIGAVAEESELFIRGCLANDLVAPLHSLKLMGVDVEVVADDVLRVSSKNKPHYSALKKLESRIYPAFPTDILPKFAVILTQCHGVSRMYETLFEGRFAYLSELQNLGANIEVLNPHQALIWGPATLRGGYVVSPDIRGGGAMMVAGIIAEGETTITNDEMIRRGYDSIVQKLTDIGVDITHQARG